MTRIDIQRERKGKMLEVLHLFRCFTHTDTPSFFVTHHLSHTTLPHTTLFYFSILHRLLCLSFLPRPATTCGAHYWKKLPCGVIRSFHWLLLLLPQQFLVHRGIQLCSYPCPAPGHCQPTLYRLLVRSRPCTFTTEETAKSKFSDSSCRQNVGYDSRISFCILLRRLPSKDNLQ